ncbi:hypothetical protein VTL71DRAFT_12617 [Oculimacula yallundae]|uniref:Uncharacterized protein n=1 Tax=Oculimacula yallundae TaxID=86028 RepID=A0ABR4CNR9_9HELO
MLRFPGSQQTRTVARKCKDQNPHPLIPRNPGWLLFRQNEREPQTQPPRQTMDQSTAAIQSCLILTSSSLALDAPREMERKENVCSVCRIRNSVLSSLIVKGKARQYEQLECNIKSTKNNE